MSHLRLTTASGVLVGVVCALGYAVAQGDLRLIQAVRNQDAELTRELVEQGVDVNVTQGDGATALHWAAHRDDLASAELLIRSGTRVNATNDLGATPIQVACESRSGAMVELLLAAGRIRMRNS